MARCDVLVIGAGATGMLVAYRAAREGAQVILVDRAEPGAGASGHIAGLLAPADLTGLVGPIGNLARHSLRLWPDTVSQLEEDGEVSAGLRRTGLLWIADTDQERRLIDRLLPLDPDDDGEEEDDEGPTVTEAERGLLAQMGLRRAGPDDDPLVREDDTALLLDRVGVLDGRRLTDALLAACGRCRVLTRFNVEITDGVFTSRGFEGVRLSDGIRIAAEQTVLCTGAGLDRLVWIPPRLRVPMTTRVSVGMTLVGSRTELPDRRPVRKGPMAVVPIGDGRVWCGDWDRAGDGLEDRADTLGEMIDVGMRARALLPELAAGHVVQTSSRTAALAQDGLPVIGRASTGLLYATGFGSSGLLYAPAAAEMIVARLNGGNDADTDEAGRPFVPARLFPQVGASR
jgi:glycine oxidase